MHLRQGQKTQPENHWLESAQMVGEMSIVPVEGNQKSKWFELNHAPGGQFHDRVGFFRRVFRGKKIPANG